MTTYDELPYPSLPRPETHPDRLAAIATLFGLDPAPIARCRVLEIGCADAGNLIPMAAGLPEASFVGIDLSPRQIADGQALADALGLRNIDLRAVDLTHAGDDLGTFDYIVAHGVFSWVPDAVRERILEVCERHLAPAGMALVSYNTCPGWRFRGALRERMLARSRPGDPPDRAVAAARAWIEQLSTLLPALGSGAGLGGAYAALLGSEAEQLRRILDEHLFHDFLEPNNDPLWFADLVARARRHGLEYVADAEHRDNAPEAIPASLAAALEAVAPDRIEREQWLDLLRNRMFRRTLLCRAGRPVAAAADASRIGLLHVGSWVPALPPTGDRRGDSGPHLRIGGFGGEPDDAAPAVVAAAFGRLASAWPRLLPFPALLAESGGGPADARPLASALLRGLGLGLVELHAHAAEYTLAAGPRPRASAIARVQAERGATVVASLRHAPVRVDERTRDLLRRLDGTRDRPALAGETGRSAEALERDLRKLAGAALLVG